MTLIQRNFRGIRLPTIHQYIQSLNESLHANIQTTNNWQSSTKNLRDYLNAHHYNSNTVSQESIDNYIANENKFNLHVNELFDKTIDKIIENENSINIQANDVFDSMLTDNTDDNNLFNLMRKFKESLPHSDNKKQDRLTQFKDFLHKEYRLNHVQSPEFLNDIKHQHDDLKNYWNKKDKYGITSYKEWKDELSKQQSTVDEIMNDLHNNPHKWEIDFERLFHEGRLLLLPQLKEFFQHLMDNTPIIEQYKLVYKVDGAWHSKPLTPEVMSKLFTDLTEANFIFDIDDKPHEYFYDENKGVANDLPPWSMFSAIRFEPNLKVDSNRDNGGSFFKYLVNQPVQEDLLQYLVKLQIFDTLTVNNKQREELNDCCFVYALSQTGCYDEETLNTIRLRIQNRYLSNSAINKLCDEFHIQVRVNVLEDINSTSVHKKRPMINTVNRQQKNYIGSDTPDENRVHEFNLFENHYFIEESTPFSCYYIKHLNELKPEDLDKYNMEIKDKYWRSARAYIKSSNLVRELFKQGFFTPITYGQYNILNTVYYKDINSDINNVNLDYNEKYCTQLIAPRKTKPTKTKQEPSYYYADFECDVSGETHQPYLVVIQSADGLVNKEFRGINCGKMLLDYVPDNSIIYFHNLAYDIRMIAKYGISKSIIKGSKTLQAEIKIVNKTIKFKDSLPMLSCKLEQLPRMFNIPDIKKEIFPYKYYTIDRLANNIGLINESGKFEDKVWSESDYQ